MNIVIAGAGIGGLTAALCLQKYGHQITLLEQSQSFAEVGAGLQCGANATKVLRHLGLLDQARARAVEPSRVEFRDYQSGAELHRMELGRAYIDRYGAPYLHLYRADLQAILVSAVKSQPDIQIEFATRLQSYVESPEQVQVTLQDGRQRSADCLIAADGVRSAVRDQLLGDQQPEFTGNVAWRAVVPVVDLPSNWMEKVTTNFVGPKKHAVLYYLRNEQLANLVGVVENPNRTQDAWMTRAPWEELKADFAGWHPMVQSIIEAVDHQQCYRWALYHHRPFSHWSSKRVTLLGDAAHATLPFMAAGAALAMEDARILARSLDIGDDLEQGLQIYQRNRMARTARVQKSSARVGKLYHIENAFLRRSAFRALGIVGQAQQSFLPDYDANTITLL